MVEYISLDIPHGSDVENPTEDDVFMAWIGAKERPSGVARWIGATRDYGTFGPEYELINAASGTLFAFVRIDFPASDRWIFGYTRSRE